MRINGFICEGRNAYPLRVTLTVRAMRNACKRYMQGHGVDSCYINDLKGFPLAHAVLYDNQVVGMRFYDGLKKYGWTGNTCGRGY